MRETPCRLQGRRMGRSQGLASTPASRCGPLIVPRYQGGMRYPHASPMTAIRIDILQKQTETDLLRSCLMCPKPPSPQGRARI